MKEKVTNAICNILTVGFIGFGAIFAIKIIENFWKEILTGIGIVAVPLLIMGIYTKISEALEKNTGKTLGDVSSKVWERTLGRLKHPFITLAIIGMVFSVGKQIVVPESSRTMASTSYTVYITSTGHKYHRAGCRYLRYSSYAVDLEKAMKNYSACSVCRP